MYQQYHVIRPKRWIYWVAIMLGIDVLLWSMSSFATCTASDPISDVTVFCSGQLDSPVRAQLGSTNVTILLDATSRAAFSNVTERTVLQVENSSRIENNGNITLSGNAGSGGSRGAMMVAVGDDNVLINQRQGNLLSTGAFNDAMVADGQGNTLLNLGSITTSGPNAFGMSASWHQGQGQPNNQLINHGNIQTDGSNARGMSILGGNGQMTNSGSVQTTGSSGSSVYMQGNNNSFVNSGFVGASGQDGAAIFANTVGSLFQTSIINQPGGEIVSEQGIGVRALNGTTTLTNAGFISSGTDIAVQLGRDANTVILQTGSQIVGSVSGGGNAQTRLILEGVGSTNNAFSGFGTLSVQGDKWDWRGSGTFNTVDILHGQLNITGSLGGALTVFPGALLSGQGTIAGSLFNQGTLRSAGVNSEMLLSGNYASDGGVLEIDSILGSDTSPTGRFVVSGGSITGSTLVEVHNKGGVGGVTLGDGIMVVKAIDGTSSTDEAFRLANSRVSAGAYSYYLFKGGFSPASSENWYLRSMLPDNDIPILPEEPSHPEKPIYREQVPLYLGLPELIRRLDRNQLGTFYERYGHSSAGGAQTQADQESWGRVWAAHNDYKQEGDSPTSFKGDLFGLQLGHTLYTTASAWDEDRYGVFFDLARAKGDLHGFALGMSDLAVGSSSVNAYGLGGYWTHLWHSGAYSDVVIRGGKLYAKTHSNEGVDASTTGSIWGASIEAGVPFPLRWGLTLQPQVQLLWQRIFLNDFRDSISDVSVNTANNLQGRVGLRLEGLFKAQDRQWNPYVQTDLKRSFGRDDKFIFADTTVLHERILSNTVEISAGSNIELNQSMRLSLKGGYTRSLSGSEKGSAFFTNLNVVLVW